MRKPEAFTYSDVHLVPKYSTIDSRSDVDTSVTLGPRTFKLPVIPANMRAVIDESLAEWMSKNDYMYIMHRFGVDTRAFVQKANDEDWKTISISTGVRLTDMKSLLGLSKQNLRVDYITIDVAHGHTDKMRDRIDRIKTWFPKTFLIAGNVATAEAVRDLTDWGADCVKVGIGQGNVCTTKDKTGFTMPMFTCVEQCVSPSDPIVIADGGIKCNGDIAKALCAGATMAMMGSQFSACLDSPAETVNVPGKGVCKRYFGSASVYNKRTKRHIEGIMKELPCNQMTYAEKLEEIEQDLSSACSYAGGDSIKALNKSVEKYVRAV